MLINLVAALPEAQQALRAARESRSAPELLLALSDVPYCAWAPELFDVTDPETAERIDARIVSSAPEGVARLIETGAFAGPAAAAIFRQTAAARPVLAGRGATRRLANGCLTTSELLQDATGLAARGRPGVPGWLSLALRDWVLSPGSESEATTIGEAVAAAQRSRGEDQGGIGAQIARAAGVRRAADRHGALLWSIREAVLRLLLTLDARLATEGRAGMFSPFDLELLVRDPRTTYPNRLLIAGAPGATPAVWLALLSGVPSTRLRGSLATVLTHHPRALMSDAVRTAILAVGPELSPRALAAVAPADGPERAATLRAWFEQREDGAGGWCVTALLAFVDLPDQDQETVWPTLETRLVAQILHLQAGHPEPEHPFFPPAAVFAIAEASRILPPRYAETLLAAPALEPILRRWPQGRGLNRPAHGEGAAGREPGAARQRGDGAGGPERRGGIR